MLITFDKIYLVLTYNAESPTARLSMVIGYGLLVIEWGCSERWWWKMLPPRRNAQKNLLKTFFTQLTEYKEKVYICTLIRKTVF